ncbi:MAG: hypothetical protein KDE03_02795 [Rhodobacteraceae bacterium]|nr:hypothetical protein [Paracoccaceae bacterium]
MEKSDQGGCFLLGQHCGGSGLAFGHRGLEKREPGGALRRDGDDFPARIAGVGGSLCVPLSFKVSVLISAEK